MHHALSSRSRTNRQRRFRPMRHCQPWNRTALVSDVGAKSAETESEAPHPVRPVRASAGLGCRARTLVMVALTTSFALLTYGSYAESVVRLPSQLPSQTAVHAQR